MNNLNRWILSAGGFENWTRRKQNKVGSASFTSQIFKLIQYNTIQYNIQYNAILLSIRGTRSPSMSEPEAHV